MKLYMLAFSTKFFMILTLSHQMPYLILSFLSEQCFIKSYIFRETMHFLQGVFCIPGM